RPGESGADPGLRPQGRTESPDHAVRSSRRPVGISVRPGKQKEPLFVPSLAGFIRFLRLRGFAVGTGSALDCAQAVRHSSIPDRDTFLATCIATVAKSPQYLHRLFESLDLFWCTH